MAASLSQFVALASKHGIEVTYEAGRKRHPRTGEPVAFHIELDSPARKVFNTSTCHIDCSIHGEADEPSERRSVPDWKAEIAELGKIIASGFSDCEDPECDHCHPVEEC